MSEPKMNAEGVAEYIESLEAELATRKTGFNEKEGDWWDTREDDYWRDYWRKRALEAEETLHALVKAKVAILNAAKEIEKK